MSISNIGSDSAAAAAALQAQLTADQKTLTDDQAKKTSQQTLTADEAKVMADQRAIANAGTSQAATAPKPTDNAAPSAAHADTSTAAELGATGGVDITA
jgi:hypothetical protein